MKPSTLIVGLVVGCLIIGFRSSAADQSEQKKSNQKIQTKGTKPTFVCPMHPEIASAKPGKCSVCGMVLVKKASRTSTPVKDLYMCPMHPEVTSGKPGECPKCGMQLRKK